jgi:hypothetical protein
MGEGRSEAPAYGRITREKLIRRRKTSKTRKEEKDMKTNHINKLARFVGMTVAIAWLAGIAGAANAQNGAKGGPSKLLELRGRGITPKTEKPSDHQTMSCAKCTDKIIQVRDTDSKGGARALVSGAPLTKSIARHGCDACGTDWAVVGIGRAKQSVATHKCTSCGAETLTCCNTKKSADEATKGMERTIQVAPLN